MNLLPFRSAILYHENMADESESFPLHECVFKGDVRKLSVLIRLNDIAKKDKHGK